MQCPICLNNFQQLDAHHIYPKAFGGPDDGELLELCSGCHQAIHSQAKSNNSKAKIKKTYFVTADVLDRARKYIRAIMIAESNYKRGVVPDGGGGEIHAVTFHVDRRTQQLLQSAKGILGFTSLDAMFKAAANSLIIKAHGVNPEGAQNVSGVLNPKNQRAMLIRAQPPPTEPLKG